jgi:hypothetical protein
MVTTIKKLYRSHFILALQDLASSDHQLFGPLKAAFRGIHFHTDKEVHNEA